MILLNFVFILGNIHLIYFGHIVMVIIDGVAIKSIEQNLGRYSFILRNKPVEIRLKKGKRMIVTT
jgi:hypothetical protein